MNDRVRKRVDSIKWLLELRDETNEPRSGDILITVQSLVDLTDELERLEREKDAAQAELVQIKLKHGDEEGIVSAAYLFKKVEQEVRAYMRRQQEAAAPKWISVEDGLPKKYKTVSCYWVRKSGKSEVVCGYLASDKLGGISFYIFDYNVYAWDEVTHWMLLPQAPEEKA